MYPSRRAATAQFLAVLLCAVPSVMAQSEKAIMLEFYNKLDGDRWKDNTGWTQGNLCDWKGIECFDLENPHDAGNEGVIKIDLESNNLNGEIPESLWKMPYLSQVMLGGNSISDAKFTGFEKDNSAPVTEIILTENSITSLEGIGNAPNSLRTLHVTNNRITGEIPLELFELNMLRRLYVSFNEITGLIPTEIGKMGGLRELFFYGNWLSGELPTELGMLDNLEIMTFAENQLSGEIPEEMNNMRSLRTFSLHNNDPDSGEHWGQLPHFEDLVYLTELYLDGNALTGKIPNRLLANSNQTGELVNIGLSDNLLTGTVPGTLSHFENLFIDVTGNLLTGVSPRLCRQGKWMNGQVELFGCDAIMCPAGSANSAGRQDAAEDECVQCSGPYSGRDEGLLGQYVCPEDYDEYYGGSDDLEILMALYFATGGPSQWINTHGWGEAFAGLRAGNTVDDISDERYDDIEYCGFHGVKCSVDGEVEELFLGDNNLQGLLPDTIFDLPALKRLDLGGNNVWFEEEHYGFGYIGNATELIFLNMSSSGLESMTNLGEAQKLQELYMTNSWITGKISDDLYTLDTLQIFHCVFCGLEGKLSPDIGDLPALKELILYGNELSGEIPSEFGKLGNLAILDLSENDFSGEIPDEINNCGNLMHFSAHQETAETGLTGMVPAFPGLSKIETLDLSHNKLSGVIPNTFLEGAKQGRPSDYISVDLSDNDITGFGSSLSGFTSMNLVIVDNPITSDVPGELCDSNHDDWMNGMVGTLRGNSAPNPCDAILCPAGTYNEDGRLSENKQCKACNSCQTLGCTVCQDVIETKSEKVYRILNELYTKTAGRNWYNNENWLKAGMSVCDYSGVTCINDDVEQGVSELDLESAGLDGTVPTSIYELPGLERLILSNNDIKLPFDGIGGSNLKFLHLSGTALDSMEFIETAPDSLEELHLAQCDFDGEIPPGLFQLKSLQRLFLNFNRFSGKLPGEIGQMSGLEEFWCFNNDLTGPIPTQIGNLNQLMVLALDENKLSGFLPTELENMQSLQKLNLGAQRSNKQIHGPLLSFSSNSNLYNLGLGGNSLEGPIPSDFLANVDRSAQIEVDLSYNDLTGAVPLTLDAFDNMDINLVANKIDTLDPAFCDNDAWMDGAVADYGCAAILCPKETSSGRGRQVGSTTCDDCPPGETALYMGSLSCHKEGLSGEREILSQIYKALNGTNWIKQRKWNSDDPICTWYGVSCDDKNGNSGVNKLQLDNNNLEAVSSSFAASQLIFKLPELKLLDVKGNNFPVDLSTVGEATKLEQLFLSGNGLKNINGIGQAKSLKEVHLTDNELSGPIPDELFELTNLEELYISFNKFSGELSPDITNWSNLRYFYAFNNDLSGKIPSQIGELKLVKELVLGFNKFSGELPQEIENLVALEQISLLNQRGSNKLSGPLPSFAAIPKLSFIDLEMNSFDGPIPEDFLRDSSATQEDVVINLAFNQLTGDIPGSFDKFSKLELDIVGNKFENIPSSLCDTDNNAWMDGLVGQFNSEGVDGCNAIACPKGTYSNSGRQDVPEDNCAECPDLQINPTIGNTICEGLESERAILMTLFYDTNGDKWDWKDGWGTTDPICGWDNVVCGNGSEDDDSGVTELLLGDNNLVGTVPQIVFMMRSLEKLDIKENVDLTISFEKIKEARKLTLLYLSDISLENITGLGNAPALEELHLTDNDMTGQIPDDFYDLAPTLKELYIAYNSFTGELSSKFGTFTKLEQFYAFNNDLSGTIPTEFGLLTNLQNLILAENVLSGAIPDVLGSLPNLQILSLYRRFKSGPRLSGPLPSFSELPSLTDLYLDSNDITGPIPSDFISASGGTLQITLAHNKLTGAVPSELGTIEELDILLEGNRITDLPDSLCDNSIWMQGDVGKYGCDALLCEKGYASIYGRQNSTESKCEQCDDPQAALYWGSTSCDVNLALKDGGEKKILELLYDECGGDKWWNKALWKEGDDVCDWYGIECTEKGTVRAIRLGSNNLAGTPPEAIFDLPDLNTLWLQSNPIQFSFSGIEGARHLTELRLDSTGLTSVDGVKNAKSLKVVDLRFNRMSGPFPIEFLFLPNLKSLSLADNELTGPLPTSFQGMPDINTLYLGSNQFSGYLPSFGDLEYLRVLDLSDNKLTGDIPQTFLAALPESAKILVDLSSNQITGAVPLGVDRFDKLTMYLRDNKITTLPSILCDGDDDINMQDGDVGEFGCNAFLCPPGTFNQLGRQSSSETPCIECQEKMVFYGQTSCSSGNISAKNGAESLMTGRVGMYTGLGAVACSLFWLALEMLV